MSLRLDPSERYALPLPTPALDISQRPQWQTQAAKPPVTPASASTTTPNAATQPPGTPADLLDAGSSLKAGQTVRSANGQYELKMQEDGNLVLRDLANNKVLWASGTAGSGAQSATMQADGNLVITKGDGTSWSSQTGGKAGSFLKVQDDGNVVIYTPDVTDKPLPNGAQRAPAASWSSGTYALAAGAPDTTDTTGGAVKQPDTPDTVGLYKPGLPPLGEKTVDGQSAPQLDDTRQGMAKQETDLLDAIKKETDPAKKSKLQDQLSGVLYQEMEYAGLQQAIPDADKLAGTIRLHTPGTLDPDFNQALNVATASYKADLSQQGRTGDQIGQIDAAAAAGDWAKVQDLTKQQLVSVVGKDQGSAAMGDLSARGGVYLTYAGGDPKFAQAVQAGIKDAQQQVLIEQPIQAVQQAYNNGADPIKAMQTLDEMTDPQTMMPGQVGQIMSDPRIQSLIKDALGKMDWQNIKSNGALYHLSGAVQHAIESDQGHPGIGKTAADQIADAVVAQADKINDSQRMGGDPTKLFSVLSLDTAHGNVGLALAVAARAGAANRPDLQKQAIDAARMGLSGYGQGVKDLNDKTATDAEFLGDPLRNFGGLSSPEKQQQYIAKLLQENPDKAKTLNEDGLKEVQEQDRFNAMKMAVAAYSPDLNGVAGFNQDGKTDVPGTGQKMQSVVQSLSTVPAFQGVQDAAGASTDNAKVTNTLWLQRSARNMVYQMAKGLTVETPDGLPPAVKNLLTTTDAKGNTMFRPMVDRGNKALSAYLFTSNAVFCGSNWGPGGLNFLENGTYALQHGVVGTTHGLTALLPDSAARPGSSETYLAQKLKGLEASLNATDSTGSKVLKVLGGTALRDTADIAYIGIDLANAGDALFHEQGPGQAEHSAGMLLSVAGDAAFLTDAAMSTLAGAGVIDGGATFLGVGMGAVGWTGVGAALMLAGAGIYTIGSAESHSHTFDGTNQQWLEAMGVNKDVAEQLGKHSLTFGSHAPSAGPSLTDYFKFGNKSEADMVQWLNTLTPDQADSFATVLKHAENQWGKTSTEQKVADMNQYLTDNGIKPPFDTPPNLKPDELNPLTPYRWQYKYAVTPF